MKKIVLLLLIGLGAVQSVNAQTLIRPRASVGVAIYDLSFADTADSIVATSYPTLGAGLTIASGNIFLDLSVDTSLFATHDYNPDGQFYDFERNDFAATLGLVLGSRFSIFGGIKSGSSFFETPYSGASYMSFDTFGLFGGGSASFRLGSNVISLNAALALMDGTLTDDDTNSLAYNETANTVGVSLGASYVLNLSNKSGFIIKVSSQAYTFRNWTGTTNSNNLSDLRESVFSGNIAYFVNF